MSTALLLAEPEEIDREFLQRHLADDGFSVVPAHETREALELAERANPALVLAGAELCRRLREGEPGRSWNRDVPVIVIGAGDADSVDRVRAFERGCDDYVERPFLYEELVARINAVLRRTSPPRGDVLEAGDLRIDRATRTVTVDGVRAPVSAKEFELAWKLATDPTRVWTKSELLREVWGFVADARTRTVDSHASRLRRKLQDAGAVRPYVINVWKIGYRLLND
jgi:DNA-binding response OmpR family regulator